MGMKLTFRQGLKADLPTLAIGEPAFCTDTEEFFMGSPMGNLKIVNDENVASFFATELAIVLGDINTILDEINGEVV